MFSCAGSALGYGLAIIARLTASPGLLLLSRIPVGLSKQTVTVSRAVVADCTAPDSLRSQWMAFLGAALGVGCVVGPFVGGQTGIFVLFHFLYYFLIHFTLLCVLWAQQQVFDWS
eukprot:Tamp_28820.p2 GENE.Tamp_28820~~Tamp_28820.p2  ORF type:complete len:115 (-),score=8.84 Tamp_28820:192-536(-)